MKKKIKDFHKYMVGCIIGIIIVGSISVYAVTTIIDSKEVSYDKKNSSGSYDNVQDSIDELYKRYKDLSGEQDTIYTEEILNGADPVLGDEMIPVTLDSKGNVKYASLYTPWYSYEEKKWANAVILVKNPSKQYKTGDNILEKDIESYFVWIPRYKYRIWDLGNYTSLFSLDGRSGTTKLTDNSTGKTDLSSLRNIAGNARLIDIVFENKNTTPSTTLAVGSYYTHPAFTNFGVSGLWVGKFETGGDSNKIIVKPETEPWKNETVGTYWNTLFNYKNILGAHNDNLDPHMMKNTEWGAVTYLSHSIYGLGGEININNNSDCKTGYSATGKTNQNTFRGELGNTEDTTQPYNTPTGYLASSTGNITGVYDMSGGSNEYMAAYIEEYGVLSKNSVSSGLTTTDLAKTKYFDKYSKNSTTTSYNLRIIGDATGELGPFYLYYATDSDQRQFNGWYSDFSFFIDPSNPWFVRGGGWMSDGFAAGQFYFYSSTGGKSSITGVRLCLSVS